MDWPPTAIELGEFSAYNPTMRNRKELDAEFTVEWQIDMLDHVARKPPEDILQSTPKQKPLSVGHDIYWRTLVFENGQPIPYDYPALSGMAFLPSGDILFSDSGMAAIWKVSASGKILNRFDGLPPSAIASPMDKDHLKPFDLSPNNFCGLNGLFIDSRGRIWSGSPHGKVYQLSESGRCVNQVAVENADTFFIDSNDRFCTWSLDFLLRRSSEDGTILQEIRHPARPLPDEPWARMVAMRCSMATGPNGDVFSVYTGLPYSIVKVASDGSTRIAEIRDLPGWPGVAPGISSRGGFISATTGMAYNPVARTLWTQVLGGIDVIDDKMSLVGTIAQSRKPAVPYLGNHFAFGADGSLFVFGGNYKNQKITKYRVRI